MSNIDFPAESATHFPLFEGISVCIWPQADGDDDDGNDGNSVRNDDDSNGDGVGDGSYSTRST
jgi:hypothetical protein